MTWNEIYDMKSYMQQAKSNNPDYILLHCGTNDLRQDISVAGIWKKIIEVAVSCKLDKNNVLVYEIFLRRVKLNSIAIQENIQIYFYKMNLIKEKKLKIEKLNY